MKVVRWVFLLPLSAIAWAVGYGIVTLIFMLLSRLGFVDFQGGDDVDATIPAWNFFFFANLAASGAFSIVALLMAPSHHKQVIIGVFCCGVLVVLSMITITVVYRDYIDTSFRSILSLSLGCVGTLLGCGHLLVQLREEGKV